MDTRRGPDDPTSAKAPLSLSGDDRTTLERNFAICTDAEGTETLVGLTRDESGWLLAFVNRSAVGRPSEASRDRYLELYEKHERARLAAMSSGRQPANDA